LSCANYSDWNTRSPIGPLLGIYNHFLGNLQILAVLASSKLSNCWLCIHL